MRKLSLIALAVLAAPALLANGNSANVSASVNVNIVAPVKLQSTSGMNFGTIVVDDLDSASSVTMVSKDLVGSLQNLSKCAAITGSVAPTPAVFHYQKDKLHEVTVTVDRTVMLGSVKLTTTNDAKSATDCYLFTNPNGVEAKHFSVAGTLDIPKGVIGLQSGLVSVTVAYL